MHQTTTTRTTDRNDYGNFLNTPNMMVRKTHLTFDVKLGRRAVGWTGAGRGLYPASARFAMNAATIHGRNENIADGVNVPFGKAVITVAAEI